MRRTWLLTTLALLAILTSPARGGEIPRKARRPQIQKEMAEQGLSLGSPIFIRIIKKSTRAVQEKPEDLPHSGGRHFYEKDGLEIWDKNSKGVDRKYNLEMGSLELYVRSGSGEYQLFKRYPVRNYSGILGPKRKQGDGQAPEGFYSVGPEALNPNSGYVLSFDLGYPNAFDKAHGRTGSLLMVHGKKVSEGCYAMGDDISEIYTILESALEHGQKKIPVHAFPFPLTQENLARTPSTHPEKDFWERELRPGFEFFENHSVPPAVRVVGKHYEVSDELPDFGQALGILKSKDQNLLEDSARVHASKKPRPNAQLLASSAGSSPSRPTTEPAR